MIEINQLVSQMTLQEKAALVTGESAWTTTPVDRLGIPRMLVSDGPHGLRRVDDVDSISQQSRPATCFPTASAQAASWDVELVKEIGQALAKEAIMLNADVILGPANNMKRSPLCGRNFEYFSEDPVLSGQMSIALINGIQSKGVGTSLKHFAANNQEYQRFTISSEVDERTLREIYLPAFEMAVKQARPWTVMCAYNRLNGTYCSENNDLLVKILKDEWGFEGLVVSDWGAVHDRVASLKGGLDLEMPGPKPRRTQAVVDAVTNGELDEKILDEAVRRVLQIVFKAAETPKGQPCDLDAHHLLARKAAAEGMVLLKNNGILPLSGKQHIAVIGRSAEAAHFQGGGSSHINPTRVDVPFKELQAAAPGVEFSYAPGYPEDASLNQGLIDEAVSLTRQADVAVLFIALPSFKESEGYDRPDLDLTPQQIALIKAVGQAQPNTVVVLNNGSAIVMSEWIDSAAAILEAWMMGQAGAGAIADVLFGKVNPSGKLSETFPLRLADTPAYLNFPGEYGKVRYGEGLYIGYRFYDAKEMPVLFPFGYGLSYTTFQYSHPTVSSRTFRDTDGVIVSVDVTNTGNVAGKEVVQVYVSDLKSSLPRPVKELKGFAKVSLQPGETKTVKIALDFRAFAFWHPGHKTWVTENGDFDLHIAASAADIKFTETVTLQSTLDLPCILNRDSTIREWMEDPKASQVFMPFFQQMMASFQGTFGGGSEDNNAIGMDTMSFLMDMSLIGILNFQEQMLPAPAEMIVDDLLHKAGAI